MINFNTYIAGTAMHDGPDIIDLLGEGDLLDLVREFDNPVDESAVLVYYKAYKLGYVPARDARRIALAMDSGIHVAATIVRTRKEKKVWYADMHLEEGPVPEPKPTVDYSIPRPIAPIPEPPYPSPQPVPPVAGQVSAPKSGCLGVIAFVLLASSGVAYLLLS